MAQNVQRVISIVNERPIDAMRTFASSKLDQERRSELGQFLTPSVIADFMTSLFRQWPREIRLLDPGAGIGSLTEAFIIRWLRETSSGAAIDITAYELDPFLRQFLKSNLAQLQEAGLVTQHDIETEIIERDFITEAAFVSGFGGSRFTHAILNPPYKKIGSSSRWRKVLRSAGIETVNLYAAFLALAIALCEDKGEIVAIVPRSFCNGTYFRPFREWLLKRATIIQIHVFESRRTAFRDDDVLQENIIIHLRKGVAQKEVVISTSTGPNFGDYAKRVVSFSDIVKPSDSQLFIHIPVADTQRSELFRHLLAELGLSVATGPVVDFRVKEHWLANPLKDSAPLLYAHHFAKHVFQWPRDHKKPNALRVNDETRKWLMPKGWYAVIKRFSSKEERRRIVAYVVDPNQLPGDLYGFENHLNVIHCAKHSLSEDLARGVVLFLNSSLVDAHFRTFSGHTQVNATDLRTMRFPTTEDLIRFGGWAKRREMLGQEEIDEFIGSCDGK